ncbi:mariner mos1 transposase [Plakobranchus ocellatus]|uniref:Mariner mos1 transposase n=1 Tax=Plakobranchus ocellatus TaxID=259542 RepID=A0AAV3YD50_9GAST|nr:mariner mos1 transposase [Plakobranchus ocellatus]
MAQSATKVIATVFWNLRGMILLNSLPKEESINADRYCETLNRLRYAVRRVAELSFNTTMQPPTRQNAQRNGLNVTGGTLFPIQLTVQTLHPQTFIHFGP